MLRQVCYGYIGYVTAHTQEYLLYNFFSLEDDGDISCVETGLVHTICTC